MNTETSRVLPDFTAELPTSAAPNSFISENAGDFNSCVVLGENVTVPWDNPHNLVSLQTALLVQNVKMLFIPLLYLVGLTNILSAAVFARQGLKERINMCLFTLALIDLAYITFLMALFAHDFYTVLTGGTLGYRPVCAFFVNHTVTGLYGISYASNFLCAVISTERCVCVLFPFHAKKCAPTRALAAVLAVLILILIGVTFLYMKMFKFGCFYETES
jgi:hypothetical protein